MTPRTWILVALSALLARSALAACYRDTDGDGYAASGATTTAALSTGACPAGYVTRTGDCDGSDPAIHPRRREIYGDNKDNNCDGAIDEPQFNYSLVRPADYSPYPILHKMSVTINDLTSAFWLTYSLDKVGYRVEITDLDGSPVNGLTATAVLPPASSAPASLYRWYDSTNKTFTFLAFNVATQLEPHHLYKVRVQLAKIADGSAIGPWSNVYYTESGGDASDTTGEKQGLRMDIALLAFHEVGESAYGSVGYRGTVDRDGWRYAHQPDGTVGDVNWTSGWCDMFWGWVAYNAVGSDFLLDLPLNNQRKGFVDPHGESSGNPWADGVHHADASYWDDGMGTGGTFYYEATKSNIANGNIGDFLLAEGHAGLYLTTHTATGNIITVEGNVSDEIKVNEAGRPHVWPAPAGRNFWVGIGKLNDYELGL